MEQILLWCGVIAGPLFIGVFLIEGYLRKGYDSFRQPVSALSIGKRGWVQQANFFGNGILLVACAFGLPAALYPYGGSFWAPLLIGLYGAGLLGAGLFVTDITGLHEHGSKHARIKKGILHDMFSTIVFASLAAATFVFAHFFDRTGQSGWATYSAVTGVLYIGGFLLFARVFASKGKLLQIGGLIQRLTISLGAIWLTLVVFHLLPTSSMAPWYSYVSPEVGIVIQYPSSVVVPDPENMTATSSITFSFIKKSPMQVKGMYVYTLPTSEKDAASYVAKYYQVANGLATSTIVDGVPAVEVLDTAYYYMTLYAVHGGKFYGVAIDLPPQDAERVKNSIHFFSAQQ